MSQTYFAERSQSVATFLPFPNTSPIISIEWFHLIHDSHGVLRLFSYLTTLKHTSFVSYVLHNMKNDFRFLLLMKCLLIWTEFASLIFLSFLSSLFEKICFGFTHIKHKVCGRDSFMIKRYEQFYSVEFTILNKRYSSVISFRDIFVSSNDVSRYFFWYFSSFSFYWMRQEFLRYQKRLLLKVTSSWNFVANCRLGQTREKTIAVCDFNRHCLRAAATLQSPFWQNCLNLISNECRWRQCLLSTHFKLLWL